MEKIYLTTMMVILFIGLTSAVTIYSGESYEIELDQPYDYWSVAGNSTEVDIDVKQNGNTVTITPNKYMKGDSFEIIFFDRDKEIIYQSSGGGGGGTTTVYQDRNITEYIDKEVIKEVNGDTVEVEKIIKKTSWLAWIILAVVILGIIIYTVIKGVYK